jgi:hypothetical protein
MRTEDNAVELVGVLVAVGQQDAAGLQHCEELRLPWLSERRQERVRALVHSQLECCFVVCYAAHFLHSRHPFVTPSSRSSVTMVMAMHMLTSMQADAGRRTDTRLEGAPDQQSGT